MTYIVHGASGAQGSPVLSSLLAGGHAAAAAVRDVSRVEGPSVRVDYAAPETLVAAYEGADGVFVHLPVGAPADQLAFAHAISDAIRAARPGRVVFSTSGYVADTAAADADSPIGVVRRALEESGVSYAIVEPRLFLENLLLPPVVGGVKADGVLRYPLRDDYAVSWVSHLDVAAVVVRLLTDRTVTGIVSVGALPALVGTDLAAGFAEHLGTEVGYQALTPAEFGEIIVPMFGEAGAAPVIASYEWRATNSEEIIPADRSAQTLLGMAPRSVSEWLAALDV